jgi:hypothetical protein
VLELRVALTTEALIGWPTSTGTGLGSNHQVWPEDQGRSLVLDMGKATLEVFDEK